MIYITNDTSVFNHRLLNIN